MTLIWGRKHLPPKLPREQRQKRCVVRAGRDFGSPSRAGYTLSRSSRFDLIAEYMIGKGIYSLIKVDEALYVFEQSLLN